MEDPEFGGMFADITIEEFNKLGFTFGDSVNISLSNGKTFEDMSYYSGYFICDTLNFGGILTSIWI